jgi:hypothetical protein
MFFLPVPSRKQYMHCTYVLDSLLTLRGSLLLPTSRLPPPTHSASLVLTTTLLWLTSNLDASPFTS